MASINRRDYTTAIPLLEQMVKALRGDTERIKQTIDETSGQKMYSVDITASQGNMLRGGIVSTTLIARLSSWGNDITADVDKNAFIWTRNSGDDVADEDWNTEHATGEKYIEVTAEDVVTQATFFCTVSTPEGIEASEQITVTNYAAQENAQASIEQIGNSISDLQQNTNAMQGEIDGLTDRANQTVQDVGDIRAQFVGLESTVNSIDKNKASLEDLASVESKFDAVFEKTAEGLLIKGVDDFQQEAVIRLLLTYDRLAFQENGVTVAYISNENLNIENAIIRNRLTVGNHEITTDGDSFELVYVGGDS